jgi:hypothetical protein
VGSEGCGGVCVGGINTFNFHNARRENILLTLCRINAEINMMPWEERTRKAYQMILLWKYLKVGCGGAR